jgi:hypothetical protein
MFGDFASSSQQTRRCLSLLSNNKRPQSADARRPRGTSSSPLPPSLDPPSASHAVIRLSNLLRHQIPRDYGPGQKKRKDIRQMSNETLRLFTKTGKGGPLPGLLFLIIFTRERERELRLCTCNRCDGAGR